MKGVVAKTNLLLEMEHSLMATRSYFLLFSSFTFLLILLSFPVEKSHALEAKETIESHFHTLQLTSLLPSSSCNTATKGKRRGASLEVVNRQGPCTQLNQKGAKAPTLTEILAHDQARVDSIQARVTDQSYDLFKKKDKKSSNKKKSVKDSKANLPAQSGLPLGTGNYIVNVGLGTPKKDLSLIFDTGSDLTWTQCQPCVKSCYAQQQPIFDPSASKTYSNISCTSTACSGLKSATGNSPGCSSSNCVYGIQYGDSSFTVGFFAKDTLTLTQNDVFDGFMFGCGQNNRGLFGKTAGLIGLGRDPLSIVQQTAQKFGKYFSYCLPTSRGSNGHLTFGNGNGVKTSKAVKNGITFTPFASSQGATFYFIDVLGISVGGKALSISPMLFQNAGTIIDSGTVITRLPSTVYGSLKSTFKQFMSKYPTAPALSLLDTCYDLSNYTSISIPKISFNFNGNANVDLEPNGILITNGASQVCLAFAGNGDDDTIGIFGNIQQQTLEVVYDVAGGQLGFGYKGCS
ncbi:aspartyl protease family protein At5g10770-like [Nicotiana sylvestris]|uniref:Protein ASPARTIC PROTEASE IN GUARD CELL 2-like n=2 Tax=Nicotiana sylvestris TaxID=4096 RepID=A0A1U7X9I0_NICSY|nr:PREDICTED: protein ASPARTIC PROTEASE IN GUARD CELL 2-like [Nicotiana sylvestris]